MRVGASDARSVSFRRHCVRECGGWGWRRAGARVRGVLNSASVRSLALVPELKLLHRKLRKAAWTNTQKFGAPISSPFIRTSPPEHYNVREKQRGAQGEYASANRVGHCGSAM